MALTERQAFVLDNLPRVTSDGARHEARYELNGQNVSAQVRSLLDRDVVGICGTRLVRQADKKRATQAADPAVLQDMRALLLTETPPPRHRRDASTTPAADAATPRQAAAASFPDA